MTVAEAKQRARAVADFTHPHDKTLAEWSLFVDVLRAIEADPTRDDAHRLAAEALAVVSR